MKDSGSRPFEKNGMYPEAYTREFWGRKSGYLAKKIWDELHPMTVLDIGCAMGYLVEDLRRLGVEAYGCDINRYALDNAPGNVKDYLFYHDIADKNSMLSLKGKVDMVVCSALQYIKEEDLDCALRKISGLAGKWFINFTYYKGNPPLESDIWRKINWTEKEWVAKIESHGFWYKGDYLYEKAKVCLTSSTTKEDVDIYLEQGLSPTEAGPFVQDKSGLVIKVADYADPFIPHGKLRARLNFNPLKQKVGCYFSDTMPGSFEKLCDLRPRHYPKFQPGPFTLMMKKMEWLNLSGYLVLAIDDNDAAIIPILCGRRNAMSLGFFWDDSNVRHRKICIGVKTQYFLIKHLLNYGYEYLFVRGGELEFKKIFNPELRLYGKH